MTHYPKGYHPTSKIQEAVEGLLMGALFGAFLLALYL